MSETHNYLAIHPGHTRVKLGLFELGTDDPFPRCVTSLFVENNENLPWSELDNQVPAPPACRSILTGSNQFLATQILNNWQSSFPAPLTLSENSAIPIRSLVDVPEKVGADRLLNAVAVNGLRKPGHAAVIVDSGTAITVDVVNPAGEFLGGAILPGVLMGARAMSEFTTTLPLIDGKEFLEHVPDALGRNTEAAMASGLYWGHLGAVRELVARISEQFEVPSQLYITGGALPILEPYFPNAICEKNLSLIGSVLTARSILDGE